MIVVLLQHCHENVVFNKNLPLDGCPDAHVVLRRNLLPSRQGPLATRSIGMFNPLVWFLVLVFGARMNSSSASQ